MSGFFSFTIKFFLVAACAVFVLSLPGCPLDDWRTAPKDDLTRAEEALGVRDIADAEMYFERYLRKNPEGVDRWEVWLQLLSISLDIRQDKGTASEYLEIMLSEFGADPPKRRHIEMALAGLYKEMRVYGRATALWEGLAADPELSDEERAQVYRELSQAYLRRLEFTTATDILELCLRLDVRPDTKADCLYAMAEAQMLTHNLRESEEALRDLLSIRNISIERKVLAVFTLADVLERQEKLEEAEELFESIRASYPNRKVVEIRLVALKRKIEERRRGGKRP